MTNDGPASEGASPTRGEFPEFQEPHLTLASPAGIQIATAASSRRYFDKGEIMPIIKHSSFGDTNWQQTSDPKDDK